MSVCPQIVYCLDAAAQQHPEAGEEEEEEDETPNYEEKAQEIVQSILQEVVNTVAGGETSFQRQMLIKLIKKCMCPKIKIKMMNDERWNDKTILMLML